MTDPESRTEADVPQRVAAILKHRVIGLVVFAVAAGLGIVVGVALIDSNRTRLAPIVLVPMLGIGLSAVARVFGAKCPACGKLFFNAPVRAFYASTGYYCKTGTKETQQH